jgi:hypothetical protein
LRHFCFRCTGTDTCRQSTVQFSCRPDAQATAPNIFHDYRRLRLALVVPGALAVLNGVA